MSAQLAAYGRLGADPQQRTSAAGKPWCTASIAVDLGDGGEDRLSQWFSVVAFGHAADALARHAKGDLVAVSGKLKLNRWTGKDGEEREQLQVIADSIVSAKSVRPGGGRRRQDGGPD